MLDCAFGTGGSMIKMKKIITNKLFFDEQLKSAEDYDYWVKNLSVLSFAAVDEILYRYRIHSLQDSAVNREKQKKAHLLIVAEHLLKYKIKINMDMLKLSYLFIKKILICKNFKKLCNFFFKL